MNGVVGLFVGFGVCLFLNLFGRAHWKGSMKVVTKMFTTVTDVYRFECVGLT